MVGEDLPSADDPGPRFVAPAGRPTAAGTDALACAKAAGLPVRLDRTTALLFLAHGGFDAHRSFLEGVGLAPSRCPIARNGDGTLRIETADGPPMRRLDFDEAARGLREVLTAAVESSIAQARRVGILLSGGLDSSSVTAAASEVWRRLGRDKDDLRLYHMLPDGPNEVEHASAVARHLGHPLTEVPAGDSDPFESGDAVLAAMDCPIGGGGLAQATATWRRMADDGVEVVLNGDCGDEFGTDYLDASFRSSLRRAAPEPLRALWRRLRGDSRDPWAGHPEWIRERGRGLPSVEPEPSPRHGLRGVAAERDRRLRNGMMNMLVAVPRAFGRVFGTGSGLAFADPRVLDFAVSIPQRHLTTTPSKALLRRAFSDALPQAQISRPKDQPYYEPTLRRQVARFGAAWFERFVHGGALERLDLVPRAATEAILSVAASGSDADLHRALRCIHLGAWSRARGVGA